MEIHTEAFERAKKERSLRQEVARSQEKEEFQRSVSDHVWGLPRLDQELAGHRCPQPEPSVVWSERRPAWDGERRSWELRKVALVEKLHRNEEQSNGPGVKEARSLHEAGTSWDRAHLG